MTDFADFFIRIENAEDTVTLDNIVDAARNYAGREDHPGLTYREEADIAEADGADEFADLLRDADDAWMRIEG